MLHRIADSLDELFGKARGALTPQHHHNFDDLSQLVSSPSPPPPPSTPSSLDYASGDTNTDSSGSSVHTPSINTSITFAPVSPSSIRLQPYSDPRRTPFGDESVPSPHALATYAALSENVERLRHLLILSSSMAAHQQREICALSNYIQKESTLRFGMCTVCARTCLIPDFSPSSPWQNAIIVVDRKDQSCDRVL
jgi:hypothetical protein